MKPGTYSEFLQHPSKNKVELYVYFDVTYNVIRNTNLYTFTTHKHMKWQVIKEIEFHN